MIVRENYGGLVMQDIDVERAYAARGTAQKLRRIAKAIEAGRPFRIQVGGKRVRVPADAKIEIEIEREQYEGGEFEIEISWKRNGSD
jgi:amphi-Trp domain-containing protein